MYNLTRHIYGYENIGSMIGVATLSGFLTYNNTDTKGYTKILGGGLLIESQLAVNLKYLPEGDQF